MTQQRNLSTAVDFYLIYLSGFSLLLEGSGKNRRADEKYCERGKAKRDRGEGAKGLTFSPSFFARIAIFFAKIKNNMVLRLCRE